MDSYRFDNCYWQMYSRHVELNSILVSCKFKGKSIIPSLLICPNDALLVIFWKFQSLLSFSQGSLGKHLSSKAYKKLAIITSRQQLFAVAYVQQMSSVVQLLLGPEHPRHRLAGSVLPTARAIHVWSLFFLRPLVYWCVSSMSRMFRNVIG